MYTYIYKINVLLFFCCSSWLLFEGLKIDMMIWGGMVWHGGGVVGSECKNKNQNLIIVTIFYI